MTDAAQQRGRKATRRDVARRAGVSDAVVTYTLNGAAPVAPATAQRVRDAIAELNYRPNEAARALKSGSARAIALIAPAGEDRVFSNPFFTEFTAAVETAAQQRGYALYTSSVDPGPDSVLATARDFASRQVDGLLIIPAAPRTPVDLGGLGIPWLQLNTTTALPDTASLGVDLEAGSFAATEHLIGHGHDRVGFVGETGDEADELRRTGWLTACRQHRLEPGPEIASDYTRQSGYAAGLEYVARHRDTHALFVASDLIALGVLRALHENGVQVPGDVALVSFDGSWEAEYTWPALTSIRQPIEAMANTAVARLLDPQPGPPTHERFVGELIVRHSCGPHPATF